VTAVDDREASLTMRLRIASNIRLAREQAGMSQTDLLSAMEHRNPNTIGHRTLLSNWENARYSPSFVWLSRIGAATGRTAGWFLDEHEDD